MTEPIACRLAPHELQDRVRAWRRLLERSPVRRQDIPGGVRLALHPDSAASLGALVELERGCCPWARWAVDGATLEVTADSEVGRRALGAWFGRAR